MRKTLCVTSVMAVAIALSGSLLLNVSHSVQKLEKQVEQRKVEIVKKEEAIRVLEAEWAYLNSPERLEQIAIDILGMSCPDPDDLILGMESVPEKLPYSQQLQGVEISYAEEGGNQ